MMKKINICINMEEITIKNMEDIEKYLKENNIDYEIHYIKEVKEKK